MFRRNEISGIPLEIMLFLHGKILSIMNKKSHAWLALFIIGLLCSPLACQTSARAQCQEHSALSASCDGPLLQRPRHEHRSVLVGHFWLNRHLKLPPPPPPPPPPQQTAARGGSISMGSCRALSRHEIQASLKAQASGHIRLAKGLVTSRLMRSTTRIDWLAYCCQCVIGAHPARLLVCGALL